MKQMYLVFLTSFLFACSASNETHTESNSSNKMKREITYLALGDSYTIGESVSESERWPSQLSNTLVNNGIKISEVDYIAKTGWTTGSLIIAIAKQKPIKHDLVSLLIGVNNQYQHLTFEQFTQEFDKLLIKAQELCLQKNRLFVVSIPDYGCTPFGTHNKKKIGEEIDQYNGYMADQCIGLNIPFIDITAASRALENHESALAFDNLHPSGFQYAKWDSIISPVVIKMLK
jgi:lysophospholipase L1-like esterase